jgi:hypothetical protein
LVKFSGVLIPHSGTAPTGLVGVTFALYKDQEGGAPLWLETQNVELDEQARYTVLLGATQANGLPVELFSSGEARWLGVTAAGGEEQPRVLLVSVPYALKAADAETLGGKPASAYALAGSVAAGPAGRDRASGVEAVTVGPTSNVVSGGTQAACVGTCTANYLAKLASTSGDVTGLTDLSGAHIAGAVNPQQVAILRWYAANQAAISFAVGVDPVGVAFDGANIWVANGADNTVTKL